MLNLASSVGVTRFSPKPFHPSVADTVQEYDGAFDELGSGDVLPVGDRDPVPCPAKFREGTQKAGEDDESITPENAALDEMCKADIDVVPPAPTGIDDDTSKQLHESGKDQKSLQRGENSGSDLLVPRFLLIRLRNDIMQGIIRMNGMVTGMISTGNRGTV